VTGLGRSELQVGAFRRHHTAMSAPPANQRADAGWRLIPLGGTARRSRRAGPASEGKSYKAGRLYLLASSGLQIGQRDLARHFLPAERGEAIIKG